MAESSSSVVTNNENSPKSGENCELKEINKSEKVMTPILLEEYKYEESPESLQNLLKFFEHSSLPATRIDILVGLIYLLMVESGFIPIEFKDTENNFNFNYQRVLILSRNVPVVFQSHNKTYCLNLVLPSFPLFEVKLAIVCVSDDLLVNCFVKGLESGYFNLMLDPLTYFTSSNTNVFKIKFQHLDHLSREVKNGVAFLVKYSILKQNGLALPCLEDLPTEVVLIIMKKLKLLDMAKLGKTNRKFYVLMRDLMKKIGKKRR